MSDNVITPSRLHSMHAKPAPTTLCAEHPPSRVSVIMPSMPIEERCAERAKLADAVARAVSDVYGRSREYKAARDRNENTVEITLVLQTARDVEPSAVDVYDDHVEKHGCSSL